MAQIAVLIPTYKPQSYIENCLNSLDNQTLSKDHYCVYVALNGPKGSFEKYLKNLLKQYEFNYVYSYISKPGVSNARNNLIGLSNEPYLAFIDDDDIISENYLEDLLRVASPNLMAISNVINFKTNLLSTTTNYIGKSYSKIQTIETSKFKSRKYYSTVWAKLIHREMIGSIRFNTKLSLGEDSLFMAEISNNIEATIKSIDPTYYYVNVRQGSATRSKINKSSEINRIFYLLNTYTKMLLTSNKDKIFVLTRIAASLKHLKRVL